MHILSLLPLANRRSADMYAVLKTSLGQAAKWITLCYGDGPIYLAVYYFIFYLSF